MGLYCYICVSFLFGIVMAFAVLGKLIYGGVYWGSLSYWNASDAPNWTQHLWLISLLQWIFSLVLPIADFVCLCMLVHSTDTSRCGINVKSEWGESLNLIFKMYNINSHEDLVRYYDKRCKTANSLFVAFMVCYLVGGPLSIIPKFMSATD